MKKHERGNEDNIVTEGMHEGKADDNIVTKGPQMRYTDEQFIALKMKVSAKMKEFDRNMELGRNLNKIIKYFILLTLLVVKINSQYTQSVHLAQIK